MAISKYQGGRIGVHAAWQFEKLGAGTVSGPRINEKSCVIITVGMFICEHPAITGAWIMQIACFAGIIKFRHLTMP